MKKKTNNVLISLKGDAGVVFLFYLIKMRGWFVTDTELGPKRQIFCNDEEGRGVLQSILRGDVQGVLLPPPVARRFSLTDVSRSGVWEETSETLLIGPIFPAASLDPLSGVSARRTTAQLTNTESPEKLTGPGVCVVRGTSYPPFIYRHRTN